MFHKKFAIMFSAQLHAIITEVCTELISTINYLIYTTTIAILRSDRESLPLFDIQRLTCEFERGMLMSWYVFVYV